MRALIALFTLGFLAACGNQPAEMDAQTFRNVTVEQAASMIEDEDALTILDIRTAEEFAAGQVPGAINVDYYADDFAGQLDALPKDGPVLVHCRSGNRSGKTLPIMRELGFTDVRHMNGGWIAWEKAGLTVSQ